MTKREKLEKLDEALLDKMLNIMEAEETDTEMLKDLTPVINYLRNNQMVAEKPKSTVEEDIQQRIKEAEKRRKQKANQ